MVARFGRVKAKPFMSNSNIKGYTIKINKIKKELNENG